MTWDATGKPLLAPMTTRAQTGFESVKLTRMAQQPSRAALHAAAEAVRAACLRAALDGYERAGLSGLCEEGRWEMVVDSIQSLDVDAIVRELPADGRATSTGPAEKDVP